jgi:hypothetical protein
MHAEILVKSPPDSSRRKPTPPSRSTMTTVPNFGTTLATMRLDRPSARSEKSK